VPQIADALARKTLRRWPFGAIDSALMAGD